MYKKIQTHEQCNKMIKIQKNGALCSLASEVEFWTRQRKACSADWSWASSSRRQRHKRPNYIKEVKLYITSKQQWIMCQLQQIKYAKVSFFSCDVMYNKGKISWFDVPDQTRQVKNKPLLLFFLSNASIMFPGAALRPEKMGPALRLTFNSRT